MLCSESSSWMQPFSHENLYSYDFLKVVEEIPFPPVYDDESTNIDIFDNHFIPTYPIAYVPSDFPRTAGMDPSVWRVLPEEKPMFVRPEDLVAPLKGIRTVAPSTSDSDHCPPLYRPTLDEFMSSMEYYRDSPATTSTARANGQSIRPKPLKAGDSQPTNSGKRSYACPFPDCSRVCSNRNDLERHLSCREHKEPSVPCPKRCGVMFTRKDSAKRHGKLCSSRATKHI